MDIKFILSFIPSFLGLVIAFLLWQGIRIEAKLWFCISIVCLLLLPVIVFKYNRLKKHSFPKMFHLKAECALTNETHKLISCLNEEQFRNRDVVNVINLLVNRISARIATLSGGQNPLRDIGTSLSDLMTSQTTIEQVKNTLGRTHKKLDRILGEEIDKERMRKTLYTAT